MHLWGYWQRVWSNLAQSFSDVNIFVCHHLNGIANASANIFNLKVRGTILDYFFSCIKCYAAISL